MRWLGMRVWRASVLGVMLNIYSIIKAQYIQLRTVVWAPHPDWTMLEMRDVIVRTSTRAPWDTRPYLSN
jgi:hypothetical protein